MKKSKQKYVGKYIVLLLEFWETDGRGRPIEFEYGDLSIHLKGQFKSLQRREDYSSESEAKKIYKSLSSQGKIEEWIKKT